MKFLSFLFRKQKDNRRKIEDVKPNEIVRIEWNRIESGIGELTCINNDPISRKILLQISWGNYKLLGIKEHEEIIFSYDSKELINFSLLNPIKDLIQEDNVNALEKRLKQAISEEHYELANELAKQINKQKNNGK